MSAWGKAFGAAFGAAFGSLTLAPATQNRTGAGLWFPSRPAGVTPRKVRRKRDDEALLMMIL